AARGGGRRPGGGAGPGPGAFLAHSFSAVAAPSARTSRRRGERSPATATDRASFGSFLFADPEDSSRTLEPSLGWTSSTRSPAVDELLDQQVPQPARALDRPGPVRPRRRPADQLALTQITIRAVGQLTSFKPGDVVCWSVWSGGAAHRFPRAY